jgi:hypothetical protein
MSDDEEEMLPNTSKAAGDRVTKQVMELSMITPQVPLETTLVPMLHQDLFPSLRTVS